MIRMQVINFEASTVEEAAELALKLGLIQVPQQALPNREEKLIEAPVGNVVLPERKKGGSKKEKVLANELAKAAMQQSGIDPDAKSSVELGPTRKARKERVARGTYTPIIKLDKGKAVTLQGAEKKGVRSAISAAKKKIPGAAYEYKQTSHGHFRVTRVQ